MLMHLFLYDSIMIYSISVIYKNIHTIQEKTMVTRIIKNMFNKNERRCSDVKTPNIQPSISTYTAIKRNTKSCTYVGLYWKEFGSYVSFPTLFACFFGFWHPYIFFHFHWKCFFYYSCLSDIGQEGTSTCDNYECSGLLNHLWSIIWAK